MQHRRRLTVAFYRKPRKSEVDAWDFTDMQASGRCATCGTRVWTPILPPRWTQVSCVLAGNVPIAGLSSLTPLTRFGARGKFVPRRSLCRCASDVVLRKRSRQPALDRRGRPRVAATHHYELGPNAASAQIYSPARRLASHSCVRRSGASVRPFGLASRGHTAGFGVRTCPRNRPLNASCFRRTQYTMLASSLAISARATIFPFRRASRRYPAGSPGGTAPPGSRPCGRRASR